TVVCEAGAIERDLLDTGGLGLLGDALADDRGSGGVATLARRAQLRAHFLLGRGGRGEHAAAVGRDHVGVDMQVGAVHRQANGTLLGDADARLAGTAQALFFLGQHDRTPYFFLVSLITTFSSA